MAYSRPVICILDDVKERCLREEQALDSAIADLHLDICGISNYGFNHLARTGLEIFPAIELDGMYFTPATHGELTYERLRNFLQMLIRNNLLSEK